MEKHDVKGRRLREGWAKRAGILWAGQAVSTLATFAASFAALWFITETTSSALWLSAAAISALLPLALLSPFGGVTADRCDRMRVIVVADGTAGLFSLALALIILADQANALLVLSLLAIRSAAQAFHGPAFSASVPLLVPEGHLVRANTATQLLESGASIAGPVLGICLYTAVGLAGIMLIDAACAGVACLCVVRAKIPSHVAQRPQGSAFAELAEGARFVWRDAPLRSLMLLVGGLMLLFMPASSLSPLMTYEVLGGDGWQASLVEAVFGAGLLAASAFMLAWGGGRRLVPLVLVSGVVIGVSLIACGPLDEGRFPLFVVAMAVCAIGVGCFNAPLISLIQRRVPEEKLGRVMGLFLAGSSLAAPVGLSFSGFVAEVVGVNAWFAICGVLIVVLCLVGLPSRSLRALDG